MLNSRCKTIPQSHKRPEKRLENVHGYDGTCLCIGNSIVMVAGQIKTKILGNGLKLVILQIRNEFLRPKMRAVEFEIRIRNTIQFMQSLQHALVKRNAVRHHRQTSHLVFYIVPNLWKQRRMICILICDTMDLGRPKIISVRHRLY